MNYIFSQISVFIAVFLIGLSLMSKNKKYILMYSIISSIFFSLQYFFLTAWEGMIINAIGILRAMCFFIYNRKEKDIPIYVMTSLIIIYFIVMILTYEGIVSIAPFIAASLFTYSIWAKQVIVYKFLAIPISMSWIIYNIYVGSPVGYVCDSILLVIEIGALIEYLLRHHKKEIKKEGK